MTIEEMQEHLARAEAEVKFVEDQLNDAARACASCGLTVREDFAQHQMKAQLEAMRGRLRRFSGSLAARLHT
jgi:hypothetical protein